MSLNFFGTLDGAYTLECDDVPSEDGIREALRLVIFGKQLAPTRCREGTR
jgi:hypothetical protein